MYRKILLFTDNHFSSTSSLIRSNGEKFSTRLENQIQSLNWLEQVAIEENCDAIICLGDFFDKPTLTDQELTALKEIKWNNLPHYFIVGNHESSIHNLNYNSTKALEKENFYIVEKPQLLVDENILMLPYIIEDDRKSLHDYWNLFTQEENTIKRGIILSHNDIKNLNLGYFVTTTGFTLDDIQTSCKLFVNGHLHNGSWFLSNARNLGNLTGQNFSEDAFKYKHIVSILNTDDCSMKDIENPYAFNFYKFDVTSQKDLEKFSLIKNNAVLSIKGQQELIEQVNDKLNSLSGRVDSRVIITKNVSNDDIDKITSKVDYFSIDHLAKFVEFCKQQIEITDVLLDELKEICK